jgi:P-type Ca2+ transporter type 2C
MADLFGYIATVLGASVFNVAEGIPLLPLQTLWVSFTMLSIQSVGARLQQTRRRADGPPAPAAQAHGLAIARTMGTVTFALFTLFFAIE